MAYVNKQTRERVWKKFGGHCAYCGKDLTLKQMQVDHMFPQAILLRDQSQADSIHSIDNLYPSCRRCNHYKRSYTLPEFRKLLSTLYLRIQQIYIVKVAIDYGIITIRPFDGVFWFEMFRPEDEENPSQYKLFTDQDYDECNSPDTPEGTGV